MATITLQEQIKLRINKAFNTLYMKTNDNNISNRPYVCIVCDRFIVPDKLALLSIELMVRHQEHLKLMHCNSNCNTNNMPESLTNCYKVDFPTNIEGFDISTLALSPRALYIQNNDQRLADGFTCCQECHHRLVSCGTRPIFSISNNYLFGETPKVLLDLTEVELALITPVKSYGFCFSYTGGLQKKLKGSLCYYKVKIQSIVNAVAHFDALGLHENIVVLLYGQMTESQYLKARKKKKVRSHCVMAAVDWLLNNNMQWQNSNINYEDLVNNLQTNVKMLDSVVVVKSQYNETEINRANVENTESFTVYYPDATMTATNGGQRTVEDYQRLAKECKEKNYDIEFQSRMSSVSVYDYKDDNLANSCLLQFPYGRGSMNEIRLNGIGRETDTISTLKYIAYLSMLSLPQFQKEMFALVLYNMKMKCKMVRCAVIKCRSAINANMLGNEITSEDVSEAIKAKRYARGTTTDSISRGNKFLSSIDAISKCIPHTNEAAKKAKLNAQALQHQFGCATFFLTVTPDDDNNILLQVYTGITVDKATDDIDLLSNQELLKRGQERTNIRMQFPGISALFFEMVLNIIIKEVIGWDSTTHAYNDSAPGLFGQVDAFSVSVEEQGRHTLHAHILIWSLHYNDVREQLYSTNRISAEIAQAAICKKVDEMSSTCCYFNEGERNRGNDYKAFPHNCTITEERNRTNPTVVCDQDLRYLRCKRKHSAAFAVCEHCNKTWTNNELLESYLQNMIKIEKLNEYPDIDTRRLKSHAIKYQLQSDTNDANDIKHCYVDASYNNHVHTASCFKMYKGDTTINQQNENDYECRYRYPQRKRLRTCIADASEIPVKWFLWDGSFTERHIKEVIPKRMSYDAFQNLYCPSISYSKLTCNTNVSFVMPGPIAQYCFNYTTKGTQKDDTEAYDKVNQASQRILSSLKKYDNNDYSEALRRLLSISHAHQNNNVLGGSLASYLTRQEERFIFSHDFVWCPLRDIQSLIQGKSVSVNVRYQYKTSYLENCALHYLCRPEELNDLSPFQFYGEHEVVTRTASNRDNIMPFLETNQFRHPSYNHRSRSHHTQYFQGVQERNPKVIVKIFQHDWPDTAGFNGSLLDENTEINDIMEIYSEKVLLLFYAYRSLEELNEKNKFTIMLRHVISLNKIHESAFVFLQNLQDCKANSFRMICKKDDLQRQTNPLRSDSAVDDQFYTLNQEDNVTNEEEFNIEEFLTAHHGDDEDNEHNDVSNDSDYIPDQFSYLEQRKKGCFDCGYFCLPSACAANHPLQSLIEMSLETDVLPPAMNAPVLQTSNVRTQHDIIQIIFRNYNVQATSFHRVNGDHTQKQVMPANGSAESIIDWSNQAKLDAMQRRAFEIITGTIVLSIFESAAIHTGSRSTFIKHRVRLQILVESKKRRSTNQLICFLHGPAGSGKTAIIDLVVSYTNQYCSLLNPTGHEDYSRTVVVTAMTGVAATLFQGQTTHSAVYMNQKRPITPEQIELWASTKLLIIDEISFASKSDIKNIDTKLRRLTGKLDLQYGGMNMLFCGDMRQLEPIGHATPVYESAQFKDNINCFIELNGMYRFQEDQEWGRLLRRFRNGEVTHHDINRVNQRIIKNEDAKVRLPLDIRYAVYFNRDRDSINTAIFQEKATEYLHHYQHIDSFIMILCDNIKVKDGNQVYVPFQKRKWFWENCGENDVDLGRGSGRMDPVLKLYQGCQVMLTTNTDVANGLANGTQAIVVKVVLHAPNKSKKIKLDNGILMQTVLASHVHYIELQHVSDRIQPRTFRVHSTKGTFIAEVPARKLFTYNDPKKPKEKIHMKATFFQIVSNTATTGHKLQGCGVEKLFIHNWSKVANWVYVMLSRVKTYEGLYTRLLLSEDTYIALINDIPKALTTMIRNLQSFVPNIFTTNDYKMIISANVSESRSSHDI